MEAKKITYEYDFEAMFIIGKQLLDDDYYCEIKREDHDWYLFVFDKEDSKGKYIFEYIRP